MTHPITGQVIPSNAYNIGTPNYDGIYHCRFWYLGEWIDVYIDDHLPVVKDYTNGHDANRYQFWGAHSRDPNELWVALTEKAFVR